MTSRKIHKIISDVLDEGDAWLVGGSVRDRLLGRTPVDYDIAVRKNPEAAALSLARKTKGSFVRMGAYPKMVFRVVTPGIVFDLTALNGSCIREDLLRRDFTVNAMALDLKTERIVDPAGGRADLSEKLIRMVSSDAFVEDPLRLLRAYRIAAETGFSIDAATEAEVEVHAEKIRRIAGERIRAELFRLLETGNAHEMISKMNFSGLLFSIFPELAAQKNCVQNSHHKYDVLEHTLAAFYHLESILENRRPEITEYFTPLPDKTLRGRLKMAMLLHDVGKPATRSGTTEIHFYDHDRVGAEMAAVICARIKCSSAETEWIVHMVRNHIRPLWLFLAQKNRTLTNRGKARFFLRQKEKTPFILIHAFADHLGKSNHDHPSDFSDFVLGLLAEYESRYRPLAEAPQLLTGKDLISIFHLSPSPLFKTILDLLAEARLSGEIENREQAVEMGRGWLKGRFGR